MAGKVVVEMKYSLQVLWALLLRPILTPLMVAGMLFAQADSTHWTVLQAQHEQRLGRLERDMEELRTLRSDVSAIKVTVGEIRATVRAAHRDGGGLDTNTIIISLLSLLLGGGAGVAAPKLRNGLRGG